MLVDNCLSVGGVKSPLYLVPWVRGLFFEESEMQVPELPEVAKMTSDERSQAKFKVAMKDAEHLKRFLRESGRKFIVFDSDILVDALKPWPDSVQLFQHLVTLWADHRRSLSKSEDLEIEELDRAIRYLITKASQKDSSWLLSNPPL